MDNLINCIFILHSEENSSTLPSNPLFKFSFLKTNFISKEFFLVLYFFIPYFFMSLFYGYYIFLLLSTDVSYINFSSVSYVILVLLLIHFHIYFVFSFCVSGLP